MSSVRGVMPGKLFGEGNLWQANFGYIQQGISMTEGGADDGGRSAWKALKSAVLVLVC